MTDDPETSKPSFLLPPLDCKHQVSYLIKTLIIFSKNLKTLVLDLDETLVHSQLEESNFTTYSLNIDLLNEIKTIYVIERPGVDKFLRTMAQYYELVLFTSGQQAFKKYAEKVLEKIDPQNKYFTHRLYRQHCIKQEFYYLKDLTQLGRNLKDIIIIDNSYECFELQPENGFLIPSFFDDLDDDELNENLEFFVQISELEDVREVEYWKEQFDNIVRNEQINDNTNNNNNEALNEIAEDSNENLTSPMQSQIYNLLSSENQEAQSSIDETKELALIQKDFIMEEDNQQEEKKSNENLTTKIRRRKIKESKTVYHPNYNLLHEKLKQHTGKPLELNDSLSIIRLKEIQKQKLFKTKSFTNILEASTWRVKSKVNAAQNVKVDTLRFDNSENNFMSPLLKNQEYYSKHSQLFFI